MFELNYCNIRRLLLSLRHTGGFEHAPLQRVSRIDTLKDFASFKQKPMHHARYCHGVAYYRGFLYVLSGETTGMSNRRECERLNLTAGTWEDLQPFPTYAGSSCIVLEATQSLYALGGHTNQKKVDLIQRLCLVALTWEVLPVKLPIPSLSIPCFKVDEQRAYFIMSSTLFTFDPHEIENQERCATNVFTRTRSCTTQMYTQLSIA
mmetsp:Transcript_25082/g.43994  ORF Transcript_25082/g.43994 Transcript_25082/m.43994 type:complete len:206 (-) Transcript_25082:73-690(-)